MLPIKTRQLVSYIAYTTSLDKSIWLLPLPHPPLVSLVHVSFISSCFVANVNYSIFFKRIIVVSNLYIFSILVLVYDADIQ